MRLSILSAFLCLIFSHFHISGSSAPAFRSGSRWTDLELRLNEIVRSKDARIGVAVIIDGRDTVMVNGSNEFPMLSVYKFPQALAVADYCNNKGMDISDSLRMEAHEIKQNTWSPMREKYGIKNLKLPISEILDFSLRSSDNNACDILFRLIGGPEKVDSLMKAIGYPAITIASTEDEMHQDPGLCYLNRSTPLEMARLFDYFYRQGVCNKSQAHREIGDIMISCQTGTDRLPAGLTEGTSVIGHKTGTGDINSQGRIIAINDAGYIFLPEGRGYSISVFIADSSYDMDSTSAIIAEISSIVYKSVSTK